MTTYRNNFPGNLQLQKKHHLGIKKLSKATRWYDTRSTHVCGPGPLIGSPRRSYGPTAGSKTFYPPLGTNWSRSRDSNKSLASQLWRVPYLSVIKLWDPKDKTDESLYSNTKHVKQSSYYKNDISKWITTKNILYKI